MSLIIPHFFALKDSPLAVSIVNSMHGIEDILVSAYMTRCHWIHKPEMWNFFYCRKCSGVCRHCHIGFDFGDMCHHDNVRFLQSCQLCWCYKNIKTLSTSATSQSPNHLLTPQIKSLKSQTYSPNTFTPFPFDLAMHILSHRYHNTCHNRCHTLVHPRYRIISWPYSNRPRNPETPRNHGVGDIQR